MSPMVSAALETVFTRSSQSPLHCPVWEGATVESQAGTDWSQLLISLRELTSWDWPHWLKWRAQLLPTQSILPSVSPMKFLPGSERQVDPPSRVLWIVWSSLGQSCQSSSSLSKVASPEAQVGVTLLGPIMHKWKSAGRLLGKLLLS